MSRATESTLDKLHALLAQAMQDELERAAIRAEANPDEKDAAISPQLLGMVARFLAMNGVNAPASAKRIEDLSAKLADIGIDLDEETLTARHRH